MTDAARPVPAVMAVLLRGESVGLVRRANPPDAGLWGFPGGRIEPGETMAAAALRELAEETGIAARPGPALPPLDVIRRDAAGALLWHYVLIPVACRWVAGEGVAMDDALAFGWRPIASLPDNDPTMSAGVAALARMALDASG